MEIEIEGVSIFDPRDGKYKVSDNPALIMLDLITRGTIKTSANPENLETFIKKAADFCDAMVMAMPDIALRALLATIRDEWGSVETWAIHAPYFDNMPSAAELKMLIEALEEKERAFDL